ncbi:helix-turn-helix domain-containing protein [Actinokineospora xionganensis]|uniref:ImmA/IrrE family metallo-endopeptidase n=1 Tax=Actinokineospora xionganensis TaxID=2684470 RepID=A0ABR7L9D9_9PSEU|nr:XRE family transcriptional regulator [Actinokineospora xionganensis]MBC6449187.1 ImmA/IrrE family metallo-endopeptidase [Actinokineospora xionganensis]
MRLLDSAAIGNRIAEARKREGLTQEQLATAIEIDRSALAKMESGTRRVSALELSAIAIVLGERVEWFVREPPKAVVSHRNTQAPGTPSAIIDRKLERAAWNVEFVARQDSGLSLSSVEPRSRPRSNDEVESHADAVRALLGLNRAEPFADMSRRVSEVGLLAFVFDLGPDAADAASLLLAQGGVAVINGHLQVGRRRLALAHELGHYVFADEYSIDWRIDDRDNEAWEARIDRFARALLLPSDGLTRRWLQLVERDDVRTAAVKIASEFQVDMSTLSRRLTELGAISGEDDRFIRSVRTTRADIVDFNLVPRDELRPICLAKSYEAAILRLFRSEIISPARAVDLLFESWDESELPTLPTLPENAIWDFV